jgi:hypothetical protein
MTKLRLSAFTLVCVAVFTVVPLARATLTSVAAPGNVLSGATTFASSEITAGFPSSHAVDGNVRFCCAADQDHGLIFSNSDPDQRLGLTGSFGAIQELRIWTIPIPSDSRIPGAVSVRSSLNSLAGAALIAPANFETFLGTFPLGIGAFTGTASGTDNTYATIAVSAPVGTQSLFLAFGPPPTGDGKGERISEVQAFVPEPGTFALAGIALIAGMGVLRRRK